MINVEYRIASGVLQSEEGGTTPGEEHGRQLPLPSALSPGPQPVSIFSSSL